MNLPISNQFLSTQFFGNQVTPFYLYPIQITAVQWLRYIESKIGMPHEMAGGILSDEMGYGKTKDMAALAEVNIVPTTLCISPITTIRQTAREFLKTAKRLYVFEFGDHGY